MDGETVVTVETSPPEPSSSSSSPPPQPQVVALETAGVTDLARQQGAQGVTLEQMQATIEAQGREIAELRSRAETQQAATVAVAAAIEETPSSEDEPPIEEDEVTMIEAEPQASGTTKPNGPAAEQSTGSAQPRRERGLLLRMFLGKSI